MKAQFAQLNEYVKGLSGLRLFYFIASCFIICLFLGVVLGYLFVLANNPAPEITVNYAKLPLAEQYYEGRIDYSDPRLYPGKNISYVLVKPNGDVLYLLQAADAMLQVAEGNNVKVYGTVEKKTGNDKYDTLRVTKVVIKSSEKK